MGQCPSSFRSAGGLACFNECPSEKGFEFRTDNGQYKCVYKDAPEFAVNLNPIGIVRRGTEYFPNLTVEGVKDIDGTLYSQYTAEQNRVAQELAIIYEKIGKDKKLKDAFARLQDAENARDQAPDAYQQARSNYYTLKEGDTWKDRERERILKAEVDPVAKTFEKTKSDAVRQFDAQRKTVDVVNGLKDKVLSLKDEVKYAADTFKDQIGKVENAIQRERRERTTSPQSSIWDWFDTILNIFILGSLLYVVYILFRKYTKVSSPTPSAPAVFIRA